MDQRFNHIKIKLEQIIQTKYFLCGLLIFCLLFWSSKYFLALNDSLNFTFVGIGILAILLAFFLIIFKNTIYTLPLIFGLCFSIGIPLDLTFIPRLVALFIFGIIIFLAFVVHWIIYKPKFKLNKLGLGFLLIMISFLIPFITVKLNTLQLYNFIGVLYFMFYIFFSNTIKGDNKAFLVKIAKVLLIFLSVQIIVIFWADMISASDIADFSKRFVHVIKHFDVNKPGWGNANDLTIMLFILSFAPLYGIYANPKRVSNWLYLLLATFVTILCFARGTMLTYALLWILIIGYSFVSKNKYRIVYVLSIFTVGVIIALLLNKTISEFFQLLFETGSPSGWSNGRIELYKAAIKAFFNHPIFGNGWGTRELVNPDKMIVYHSTFFHVLAVSGIVGILILVYHFFTIFKLLFTDKYPLKIAFCIIFIITQLQGLVDNTQYMIFYTVLTTIILVVFESSETYLNKNYHTNEVNPFV